MFVVMFFFQCSYAASAMGYLTGRYYQHFMCMVFIMLPLNVSKKVKRNITHEKN